MSLIKKPESELAPSGGGGLIPPVNVYEKDGSVVAELAVIGIDPKDIEVSVEDNVLTVRGKTERKTEVDEKDYYYKEMRYGAFQRKITLPVPVLGEKAETASEHGLLKISIPKK